MTGGSEPVRVLHVDDDGAFSDLTATMLERENGRFVVETAGGADEGLERLTDRDIECIVSDYEMPGTDGLAFLDAVREDHPDLPFILFTGKGSEAVASEAIARGATDYLRKRTGSEQYELLANRIENGVEQYRAARRAAALDRVNSVLGEVNRALVRAETREEIERRVCDVLRGADPYRFAWIGEHDRESGTVTPRAVAGVERGYLDCVEIAVDDRPTGQGPTGKAVRTRDVAVVQDISDDPAYEPWREDALDREYRASAAVPLVSDGTLYGVLNVYADRLDAFDERERALLSKLGTDVAHAIARSGERTRRVRYERIVENLPVGVYRATPGADGEFVDANPALADLIGADSVTDVIARRPGDFYRDPADRAALSDRLDRDGVVRDRELHLETLDGDEILVSVTAMRTEVDGETYFDGIVRDITERSERERDLDRFRSAVEHAGHVVLLTDTDATIEYVNEAFEETTGYAPSEAIGRSPAMLKSGEHDSAFYRDLWETILAGEVWQGEVINERKDGERYVIDQTIAPITERDGSADEGAITGFVAVNRDVTERKERERDLTFLKRAVDHAGIGIGTSNDDGEVTYVNNRFATLLDVEPEALRGESVADLGSDLFRDSLDGGWNGQRTYDTRVERVGTDETVPAEVVVSRATIDDEPYLVSMVRDITAHRERERDLDRFRSAVEHAGHGVVITDTDGTIEYVNEAFEETTGYAPSEAIGRSPAMLKSGEHDSAFYRDLWETILAGEVWQGEVVNERKDGERYVIDQTIAPITERDGSADEGAITGFVAVNRDVTDLKAYERELEQQNERLAQYGHTVAHDLRNPLNLLHAEIQQLRLTADRADGALDPATVRRQCADITDVAERMGALVDDLLTMAEQGQLVLDSEPVSLAGIAREAWGQTGAPDATVAVEDSPIDADPDRLRELLSNLFRNAVEHGGDGVDVKVGPLDFADGFFVADDGPGIPPDERDDVLERGFTTDDDGTGFGLAIVEQIADAHGWTVEVTESRDGGARFEFRDGDSL